MLVVGDTGEGGARLALAAGAHHHDLVARQVGKLVLVEKAEVLRQIAGLDGDCDDAVQRAPGDDELSVRRLAPPRDRCKARDIRGEAVTATRRGRLLDDVGQRFRNVGLGRRDALAHRIGRIADHREHAFVAELAQARLIGGAPTAASGRASSRRYGRRAVRRADRERVDLRDRMGQGDQLDVERPHLNRPPSGTSLIGICSASAVLGELCLQHAGGERRRKDRRIEPRPQVDHRADVVLVRVRQDDAGEVARSPR